MKLREGSRGRTSPLRAALGSWKGPSPHRCLQHCRQTNRTALRPNSGRGVIPLPKNICLLIITHYQLKQFHNEAMRPNEVDVIIG